MNRAERIMPESRGPPRWLPRIGADIRITFGEPIDVNRVFVEQLSQWRFLKARLPSFSPGSSPRDSCLEGRHIRSDVARGLRDEFLGFRRSLGYPDQD
jgi:monolysocardiolipin acyltransferase